MTMAPQPETSTLPYLFRRYRNTLVWTASAVAVAAILYVHNLF